MPCLHIVFSRRSAVHSDTAEQHREYARLRRCLQAPPHDQSIHNIAAANNSPQFSRIYERIVAAFINSLNAKLAQLIAARFAHVIEEEQFEDLGTIQDDFDDEAESIILAKVVEDVAPRLSTSTRADTTALIESTLRDIVISTSSSDTDAEPNNSAQRPRVGHAHDGRSILRQINKERPRWSQQARDNMASMLRRLARK